MSYHLTEAVSYVAPDFTMLYNKVQITKGELLGLQNPVAAAIGSNQIEFTWENNSDQGGAATTDNLVVVVFEPVSSLFYFILAAGERQDGVAAVTLPNLFVDFTVHSWIAFAATDEKSCATSIHMGSIVVT